jgi:hypothetical protein
MKLSQILEQDAQGMYHAAEGLFRMVDDLEWKPSTGTNWMSTAQLLHHCTNACGYTINGFVNGDWGLPEGVSMSDLPMEDMLPPPEKMPAVSSVDEALSMLDQDRDLCMKVLSASGRARLLAERSTAPWGGPEVTLFQHCTSMIWHLGQHKGQLFYYLKLQGKDVNTMHLWMG